MKKEDLEGSFLENVELGIADDNLVCGTHIRPLQMMSSSKSALDSNFMITGMAGKNESITASSAIVGFTSPVEGCGMKTRDLPIRDITLNGIGSPWLDNGISANSLRVGLNDGLIHSSCRDVIGTGSSFICESVISDKLSPAWLYGAGSAAYDSNICSGVSYVSSLPGKWFSNDHFPSLGGSVSTIGGSISSMVQPTSPFGDYAMCGITPFNSLEFKPTSSLDTWHSSTIRSLTVPVGFDSIGLSQSVNNAQSWGRSAVLGSGSAYTLFDPTVTDYGLGDTFGISGSFTKGLANEVVKNVMGYDHYDITKFSKILMPYPEIETFTTRLLSLYDTALFEISEGVKHLIKKSQRFIPWGLNVDESVNKLFKIVKLQAFPKVLSGQSTKPCFTIKSILSKLFYIYPSEEDESVYSGHAVYASFSRF